MKESRLSLSRSRFIVFGLLAFLVGIFLSEKTNLDWWVLGVLIGLVLGLVIFYSKIYFRLAFIVLLSFSLGLSYFHFYDLRQKAVVLPFDQEIEIEGQIVGHPDILSNQSRYLVSWQKKKIQVTTGRYPQYNYGDIVRFKGTIKEPYPYLFYQGILGQVYNPEKVEKVGFHGNFFLKNIYQIRDKFEQVLNRTLNEPYSSFAAGIVLGSKRNIPDSLMTAFNRTGTTHIIAVSGYNVTIVTIYIGLVFGLFSRRGKFLGIILAIIVFVLLTGAAASVLRAGILAGLVAWGHFEGRRINMAILLLLVASVMLLFNPYMLKYDISFQLSFLAFIGLVYFSSILSGWRLLKPLPKFIKSPLSETLSAQIFVLPILIYYFGNFSLVAPIVNILVLWLIPATMLIVFIIGLIGFFFLPLAQLVGFFGWVLLKYILIVVEWFSFFSWSSFQLKTSEWWWIILFYAIIGTLLIKFRRDVHEPA